MEIKSVFKNYQVHLEENFDFINKLNKIENSIYVIDKNVYELYKQYFNDIALDKLYILEATEQNKVIDTALEICEKITEIPAKRNSTLISIGGGITQDVTGFVANITYRGINWIFVPTTLLAACDSCIGSKTSLNYKKYKNLLGTFYPPNELYICPHFFMTLTDRDYKSGLGEVVKFNIMKGLNGLDSIEKDIDQLLGREPLTINKYVESSLAFKKTFIEVDEFDKGERIKLNFAHTFGHAIEVITNYIIPHGTAVAIGMIIANHISYSRGYLSKDIVKRSEQVLLKVINVDVTLLERPLENYLKAIKKDKKQVNSSLTSVLITKYSEKGELTIVHDTKEEEIQEGINHFISLYKEINK